MAKGELQPNGPIQVQGAILKDFSGQKMTERTDYALCRCGHSSDKPFCDGTHAKIGFDDTRQRELRRGIENYVGAQITIHDHRYLCAHYGACRLKGVFELRKRPWIDPDGTQDVNAVIDVIEDCPSGALTYSIDGNHVTDWHDEPEVRVQEEGPLHFRGSISLEDEQGSAVLLVSREHYTLCRCGASKHKPFCDGTHKKRWGWSKDGEKGSS
ncbi:MAG: CDGSH iron-sulfur domain-containing protein [Firmicutes bacterium]|nr:CDGSH iron-sulfur domain-containing protein [Bacillota bacterium]